MNIQSELCDFFQRYHVPIRLIIKSLSVNGLETLISALQNVIDADFSIQFSPEERTNLLSTLNFSNDELNSMIEFLVIPAKTMTFANKPHHILQYLTKIGCETKKAELIVKAWFIFADEVLEKKKEECFDLAACQLTDVNWKIRLNCSQTNQTNLKKLNAQLDLVLKTNQGNKVKSLEFNHQQLTAFYNELETLQQRLDSEVLNV